MKNLYVIFFIALATFGLSATNCNPASNSSSYSSSAGGTQKTETRTVSKFSGIDLDIAADIKLTQGTEQKVELEGAAGDLERISTEVHGSSLKIKSKSVFGNLGRITLYITMESISNLHLGGSGAIHAQTPIKTTSLDLSVSGSGNITIPDLTATTVTAAISGSGSLNISGKGVVTDKIDCEISGSGNISASDFIVKSALIGISGSGTCKLNVTEKLSAQVSGSGNIYYAGKPVITANVSGSGRVKPL